MQNKLGSIDRKLHTNQLATGTWGAWGRADQQTDLFLRVRMKQPARKVRTSFVREVQILHLIQIVASECLISPETKQCLFSWSFVEGQSCPVSSHDCSLTSHDCTLHDTGDRT